MGPFVRSISIILLLGCLYTMLMYKLVYKYIYIYIYIYII